METIIQISNPDPAEIRQVRQSNNLTQDQAANLTLVSRRTWQDWERGIAPMHPAFWDYFRAALNE